MVGVSDGNEAHPYDALADGCGRVPKGHRSCVRCRAVLPRREIHNSGHCDACEEIRIAERDAERADAARQRPPSKADMRRARQAARAERRATQEAERAARGLVPIADAAVSLGLAPSTLHTQVHQHHITPVREGGRLYIHQDEIERYRREQRGQIGYRLHRHTTECG